ncbi:MAG: cation:proton antiporter [Erysipelotrichaceae bacterium]|nr:cation:proton antiporter [Erysipelotrichaceae bacterium]MDY5252565.1 cation:proton antiporter [Erysipelotrichaceae bacterium]
MMDIIHNSMFLQCSIIFITGLIFSKLAKLVKLPAVTGYLVGGLLLGPYVLNFVTENSIEVLAIFSDIALAFIAFNIGSEFKISYFKKVGMAPIIIACLESLFAVLFVFIALILTNHDLRFSMMLSAIAAATAPAATIMVIKQYRANGPVTKTLLSVVAIDDATALILFGFALAITNSLTNEGGNLLLMLFSPIWEIIVSIIIGGIMGLILSYAIRFYKDDLRVPLIIAILLLTLGLSAIFDASSLLVCMVLGAVFCNLSNEADKTMTIIDGITPSLFMMFFVLSGAELNVSILPSIGMVGIIYVVFRVIGKCFGAYAGAKLSKASESVCKYIGPCLIPQAGVAIGLSLVAQSMVPEFGSTIRAVILCGTLIYELIGPFVTKKTLIMAKEITEV